jgi:Transmembrane Fragile-X-F protein
VTSKTSSSSSSSGVGFAGLLTIVFIVLKLLHKIAWSWLWVLSPLWIGAAFAVALIAVMLGVAFIAVSASERRGRRLR